MRSMLSTTLTLRMIQSQASLGISHNSKNRTNWIARSSAISEMPFLLHPRAVRWAWALRVALTKTTVKVTRTGKVTGITTMAASGDIIILPMEFHLPLEKKRDVGQHGKDRPIMIVNLMTLAIHDMLYHHVHPLAMLTGNMGMMVSDQTVTEIRDVYHHAVEVQTLTHTYQAIVV